MSAFGKNMSFNVLLQQSDVLSFLVVGEGNKKNRGGENIIVTEKNKLRTTDDNRDQGSKTKLRDVS